MIVVVWLLMLLSVGVWAQNCVHGSVISIFLLLPQSPFISMMNANYCNLEEQTLTLLLRSVRANCGLKVLKLVGNNLTGKGTFILSKSLTRATL